MGGIYLSMISELCLPIGPILSLLVTIPKKLGGTRCIAILPAVMRVFLALFSEELRDWDLEVMMGPKKT